MVHTDYEFWTKSICPACGRDYGTPAQRNIHMSSHTGGRNPRKQSKCYPHYPCLECPDAKLLFLTTRELEEHRQRVHLGKHMYNCSFEGCIKTFWHRQSMIAHRKNAHNPTPLPCPYPNCQHLSKGPATQYWHLRTKHPKKHTPPIVKYQCQVCLKKFSSQSYRNFHEMEKHNNRPFSCNYCKSTFFSCSALTIHWQQRHAPYSPPSVP